MVMSEAVALLHLALRRQRQLRRVANTFDLRWLRILLTAMVPALALNLLSTGPVVSAFIAAGNVAFGMLFCLYHAHILFRRLQCSVLELSVIVIVIGNALGLFLTTPGISVWDWTTVACLSCCIVGCGLAGAVTGLTTARLLQETGTFRKLFHLAMGWMGHCALAFLLAGGLIVLAWFDGSGRSQAIVGKKMLAYGPVLLGAGVFSAILPLHLCIKAYRASKAILGQRLPAPPPSLSVQQSIAARAAKYFAR
jgi:hypothetical protein